VFLSRVFEHCSVDLEGETVTSLQLLTRLKKFIFLGWDGQER